MAELLLYGNKKFKIQQNCSLLGSTIRLLKIILLDSISLKFIYLCNTVV